MNVVEIVKHRAAGFPPDTRGAVIYKAFQGDPSLSAVAIVDAENQPLGLINRSEFFVKFSERFGRALFESRPATLMMDADPLTVHADATLDELHGRMSAVHTISELEGFVVVDDNGFLGVGSGVGLLRAVIEAQQDMFETIERQARDLSIINDKLEKQVEKRARAETHARSDPLTKLSNRRGFIEMIEHHIDENAAELSVAFIDLDRFKAINDLHGHAVGDKVLSYVAARLEGDGSIAISRLGGDEFAAIIVGDHCDDALLDLCEDLRARILAPIRINGLDLAVGASVGIARFGRDAQNLNGLLRAADLAMIRAKQSGGGVRLFDHDVDRCDKTIAELENAVSIAVKQRRIIPHFQPAIHLETGDVVGFEVLARWPESPDRMVGPSEFVPIAERLGLVDEMFWMVFERACQAAKRARCYAVLAVNVSPLQLQDIWFPEKVIKQLTQSGIHPKQLEIEVTESAMVADLPKARQTLESLAAQGVSIALDDFGTGYSSLLLLQTLPLTKLKIDRSFVLKMTSDESSAKIVAATISMAKGLGIAVTAEGVETAACAKMLRDMGCDIAQGFYFGRAAPGFETTQIAQKAAS